MKDIFNHLDFNTSKVFMEWEPINEMVRLIMNLFSDIKRLYFQAGVENKPTVFLFVDTQVQEESFLEDINNVLSSGEVPNLYKPDEFEEVSFTSMH